MFVLKLDSYFNEFQDEKVWAGIIFSSGEQMFNSLKLSYLHTNSHLFSVLSA